MSKVLACICLLLGVASYGLLAAWIFSLSRLGGLSQVAPQMRALGWEAVAYVVGLVALGSMFLVAAAVLAGRR